MNSNESAAGKASDRTVRGKDGDGHAGRSDTLAAHSADVSGAQTAQSSNGLSLAQQALAIPSGRKPKQDPRVLAEQCEVISLYCKGMINAYQASTVLGCKEGNIAQKMIPLLRQGIMLGLIRIEIVSFGREAESNGTETR